jgi:hypothetical protein
VPILGRKPQPRPLRVLTASAVKLDLKNKTEARQLRALSQGWQADAWNFRDSIPELRYAVQFKANAMARMRLFVGVEPEVGESEKPVPLDESTGIPDQFAEIARKALADLAVDEGQRRDLLKKLSTSVDVPGEARILGQTNPETGEESWSVRSTDEIEIRDDGYWMREIPDGPQGIIPWTQLDPELTALSRVWVPHPRFELMADSPMKAILQNCETLLLLRRMIRAEARSRLNRGLLTVPDELSIKVPEDDNEDPQADPFMASLTQALIEPIGDEGVASAYAPIAVRGPAEILKALSRISLTEPFEEQAAKCREELLVGIAVGIDVPNEIFSSSYDANHWSSWQVDDNTFRHHLEPHAITLCDMLTGGYFRERIIADGVPPEYAHRMVIWYDPVELITHPDRTADALKLHENLVLSDAALLREAGFAETDAPSKQEIQVRLLEKMRTWPPNLVMAFLHAWDPTLVAPAMVGPPAVPGISPTGVDTGEHLGEPLPGRPGAPAPQITAGPSPAPSPTPAEQPEQGPPPITASGAAESRRLSLKLAQIDRDLRTRLQVAANAAMLDQLAKVGGRLRTKVAKDETMRSKIAHRRNDRVSAVLGRDAVTAAGIDGLPDESWAGFRDQFYNWTSAAQEQALRTAVKLGALSDDAEAVKLAKAANTLGVDKSWEWLSQAMTKLGEHLMFNPDPNVGPTDWGDLNPDTIVPTGMLRAACGIAGGNDVGVSETGEAITTLGEPVGQIGTGATVTELLEGSGAEVEEYQWEHASMTIHPFEPHLDLDGIDFTSFDSEALANTSGFPGNAYYFPGDHEGCSCDFCPMWVKTSEQEAS